MKKYLAIIALLCLIVLASGCTSNDGNTTTGDITNTTNTGDTTNTTSQSTSQSTIPETNKLVLTITESQGSASTYNPGDTINIDFDKSGQTFTLSDRYGTFSGKYSVSGNVLTLDFDSYPAWTLTLAADGTFTGSEAGKWSDKGTYKWK